MTNFTEFKNAIQRQLKQMEPTGLYNTNVDNDVLWNTYLDSFPAGTNKIFRERREYDCSCCRQFIKNIGGVVTIVNNQRVSIWDIQVGGYYQPVIEAMKQYVNSCSITDPYFHYENKVGTDFNHEEIDGKPHKWEHFYTPLASQYVLRKDMIPSRKGDMRSNKDVLLRSLEELSLGTAQTVMELIEQGSLYRGEEHKRTVEGFIKLKKEFNKLSPEQKEGYVWIKSKELGGASKIRNTVIGTLLVDIEEGRDLDAAVTSFEAKVAPTNYKRPTALVTKAMIQNAQKKVEELGIDTALERRYAVETDITINNVLFADRSIKKAMNVFDELIEAAPTKVDSLNKVEEISIDNFLSNVLPKASSLEVLFENKHQNNLVSLIAPKHPDAKPIFKWDNNFSWSYKDGVADSMRQKVVNAGGRVDGDFRFTHEWNYDERNCSLMDLHVFFPNSGISEEDGCNDSYGNNQRVGWNNRKESKTGGIQDVDYVNAAPEGYVPIENITFPDRRKMPEGKYICKIHNWNLREPTRGGFRAEIEFDGQVFQYEVRRPLKHKEWITVAHVTLKNGEFSIEHKLPCGQSQRNLWGINTNSFHKVKMIMNSPNHWDGNQTGNRHLFFILDKCKQEGQSRGFYNEFLKDELTEHRKVFEVLGSKMKVEDSENQLSGLGFSSTQRNSAYVKVSGSFNRVLKVNF